LPGRHGQHDDESRRFSGGQLVLENARAGASLTFGAGRSLEFTATFGNEVFQHVGFGTDFNAGPRAIFSTGTHGSSLKAHQRQYGQRNE